MYSSFARRADCGHAPESQPKESPLRASQLQRLCQLQPSPQNQSGPEISPNVDISSTDRFTPASRNPEEVHEEVHTESKEPSNWFNGPIGNFLDYWFGIKQVKQEAQAAMLRPPAPISGENPLQSGLNKLLADPAILETLTHDDQWMTNVSSLLAQKLPLAVQTGLSRQFAQATPPEQTALLLSHMGVGAGKLCQILADDPRVPHTQRAVFRQLQSKGAVTRTLPETQNLIDQLYPAGKYKVLKPLGVGTIGEVYLAKQQQQESQSNQQAGQEEVVIKLLKAGVTTQSLDQEKAVARVLIQQVFPNPKQQTYQLKRLEALYQQWATELNFATEAENAQAIAHGATRYQVAQTLECGYHPQTGQAISLVQEIAPGVELKKLNEWLSLFKVQPHEYFKQINPHLHKIPWLKDPTQWRDQLPKAFRGAFNEQLFLRTQNNQSSTMHGDPHSGNVFININPTSKQAQITFIDAGLALSQTSKQAAQQIGLLLGSISGNSAKLSDYILSRATIPADTTPDKLRLEFMQALDERLFKANVNLTDCQYNQQFMDALLEEKGVILPESETMLLKAQMQAIRTYDELSQSVGQPQNNYLRDSIPDLYHGLSKLLKTQPLAVGQELIPAGLHYWRENPTAIRNTLQFLLPKPIEPESNVQIDEVD